MRKEIAHKTETGAVLVAACVLTHAAALVPWLARVATHNAQTICRNVSHPLWNQ